MRIHRLSIGLASAVLALSLACGGGGGGSSAPAPTVAPVPTPTPTPTAPPVISALASSDVAGQRATLTWTTDHACTAEVTYQKTGGTEMVRKLVDSVSTRSLVLDLLEPSTEYTVTLKVTDANNLTSTQTTKVTTTATGSTASVTVSVDPATTKAISPYIYGMNTNGLSGIPAHLTIDRMGGNRWTAYNWESNASNAGNDYIYSNDGYLGGGDTPGEAARSGIALAQSHGYASIMTVQMQGYVAADKSGAVDTNDANRWSSRFKKVVEKKSTASPVAFTTSPDTSDANVYMDEFVWAMNQKFPGSFSASATLPIFASLDNEPDLWNSTHKEIQGTTNISSDAYIQKTVTMTKALKDQFPDMKILGPAHYGFNGFYSWQGETAGNFTGSYWFTDKYLQVMKDASTTYGHRLVDAYDLHFYSEVRESGKRVTEMTTASLTDAEVQAIVQSPRSLWDPTFTESSWIASMLGQPIQLLNRMQTKIDTTWPGTQLAITEYYNGGDAHIAGAIAQADNLGIFGVKGIWVATLWPNTSSVFPLAGFKAYRGFDGTDACFGDTSLGATSSDVSKISAYVSRDGSSNARLIIVAINRSTTAQDVNFSGLAATGTAKVYRIDASGAAPFLAGQQAVDLNTWIITLPPLTVSTIEIK